MKMNKSSILLLLVLVAVASAFASKSQPPSINLRNNKRKSLLNQKAQITLHAAAAKAAVEEAQTSTIATSTFNLAKSIVGAGVLSLPSGIAFFADEKSALIPASLMCAIMGVTAAYSFSSIGRSCEQNKATSFQDAWAKSVDPKSAWLISASITAMCFLASLAYSIIIGDSFTSLAASFSMPAIFQQRNNIILTISALVLLPLCSLKSLASLTPFSLLGLGGTLYTALVMALRYFDKSYAAGGKYFAMLAPAMQPSFSKRGGYSLNQSIFVLLSMLSTSYIAHYNAPKFYNELKDKSLPRFNTVVNLAFGVSIALFVFMMGTGFLTFGGTSAGFVLNNYAGADRLISLARLAIGLALLTGYPFTFSAFRDGILDLSKVDPVKRAQVTRPLTTGLLSLVTVLALFLQDVGFVVSVSGALFGSLLMFVVPSLMNIADKKKLAAQTKKALTNGDKLEVALNYLIILTGVSMGAIGVAISTLRQFGKI